MTNKSNGNGNSNGHDPDHNGEKEKIVKIKEQKISPGSLSSAGRL